MLPRADIAGTRPVGRSEAPTPTTALADARQETFNRLAQVAIGKQFQADILSRLNDGTFLVRVADTVARMNLPAGIRAGDSVAMTLVSADPRPTFLLGSQANGPTASLNTSGKLADRFLQMAPEPGGAAAATGKPAPAAVEPAIAHPAKLADPSVLTNPDGLADSAKLAPGPAGHSASTETALAKSSLAETATSALGKTQVAIAPAMASASHAGAAPPGSAPTSLSTAGRVINNILQAAQQDRTSTAVSGKAPLVFSSAASAPQLAVALRDALVFSGLFYESHVAQWAGGKHSARDLMREPQANTRNPLPTDAAPVPARVDEARLTTGPVRELHLQAGIGARSDPESVALAATVNTESARLINLQLNTLENQRVLWQGELWPGQQLEWEISKDAPDDPRAADVAPHWTSSVRFDLPTLGLVSATVTMAGAHVRVLVRTATDAAAAALREHGGELAAALDAAGSPLDSLTVKQDGKI